MDELYLMKKSERMKKRFCLGLDLKDNPRLIEAYKKYHEPGNVWPEIIQSIYDSGILDMEIYLVENRLFMIIEADKSFTLERKAVLDESNDKVQEWEALMQANFQKAVPWETEIKWVPSDLIFKLTDHNRNG